VRGSSSIRCPPRGTGCWWRSCPSPTCCSWSARPPGRGRRSGSGGGCRGPVPRGGDRAVRAVVPAAHAVRDGRGGFRPRPAALSAAPVAGGRRQPAPAVRPGNRWGATGWRREGWIAFAAPWVLLGRAAPAGTGHAAVRRGAPPAPSHNGPRTGWRGCAAGAIATSCSGTATGTARASGTGSCPSARPWKRRGRPTSA
jgi:hypothetical protein